LKIERWRGDSCRHPATAGWPRGCWGQSSSCSKLERKTLSDCLARRSLPVNTCAGLSGITRTPGQAWPRNPRRSTKSPVKLCCQMLRPFFCHPGWPVFRTRHVTIPARGDYQQPGRAAALMPVRIPRKCRHQRAISDGLIQTHPIRRRPEVPSRIGRRSEW
jgi:hypothetical protein